MKFINPAYAGEVLEIGGLVTGSDAEPGSQRLNVEVWVKREDRTMNTAGWTSAAVAGAAG